MVLCRDEGGQQCQRGSVLEGQEPWLLAGRCTWVLTSLGLGRPLGVGWEQAGFP